MWQIFKFLTNENFLFVKQLAIHLLKKSLVDFEKNIIVKKLQKNK